jgi:predicted  nucleic acid-binding Zn-ribbon protein
MLSMIHLNYQTDLENQKLKYEKMLDRLRFQVKKAQHLNGNEQEGNNLIIKVDPYLNNLKDLQYNLEATLQEKENLEKEFLNLAENYEQLKQQLNPEHDVDDLKSKEIEELREENEYLKMQSAMCEDDPVNGTFY